MALASCGKSDPPNEFECETATDCFSPPPDECDGGDLVSFVSTGFCSGAGTCVYSESGRETCEFGCGDGECLTGQDFCDLVTCDRPPNDRCDGDVLVSFEDLGTCGDGECTYPEIRTDCTEDDGICLNNACQPTSCDVIVCNEPPDNFCDDEIATRYGPMGACMDSECTYTPIAMDDCAAMGMACLDGECVDQCVDVVCSTPDADFCDGDTAVQYDATGTCDGGTGECSYGEDTDGL